MADISQGTMHSEPGINAAQSTAMGDFREPVVVPEPIPLPPDNIQETPPEDMPEEKPTNHHSELDDLFDVPQEDDPEFETDDLTEVDMEDVMGDTDMSDLTDVNREDVMGRPPRHRRLRKPQPPPSMGGMQV